MSRVVLLNSNDPTFGFEHAMAHRNGLGAMAPLSRFSVLPYMLDPMQHQEIPGSMWHLDHQQAHNDALDSLPSYFGSDTAGLAIGGILRDYNLDDASQRTWWTFQNHMEHYVGGDTITPNVELTLPFQWTYPFW